MKIRFVVVSFLVACSLQAHASDKYCSKDKTAKAIDLHLFMHTFTDDSQKKLAIRGLTELKSSFRPGDRIRVFRHTLNGYNIAVDKCVPGCPEKGFLDDIFRSECSAQVAKRDRLDFERMYASSIIPDARKAGERYNIYKSVQSLADFYGSSKRTADVFAAISMVPFGVDVSNRSQLDKEFVVADTSLTFPHSFPPVKVIGALPSKELNDFWKDVFRRKGQKFELDAF